MNPLFSYILQLFTGDEGNIWYVWRSNISYVARIPSQYFFWLYLHRFRIKYSIQTIYKQTNHDQTGLNLDELIWDELPLMWINSNTITHVHVIQVANNKLTQLGTNWFRTKSIQNESTCLWGQTRHSGPTSVLYALGPTLIFICPLPRTLTTEII